jgi:hypothetical protein
MVFHILKRPTAASPLAAACAIAALLCPSPATADIVLEEGEIELVGGVFAAAAEIVVVGGEPAAEETDEAAGEEKSIEPAVPLTASEAILLQLDFNPHDERYPERAASLFLDPEALADVRQRIADLDADDFRARNEASKRLAMVEAPIEHMLGAARTDAEIEKGRRIQSILNVRLKKRPLDALYHAADKIAADEEHGYVERLLAMASTFGIDDHWELMRVFEFATARSARKQDEETLIAAAAGEDAAGREIASFALGYRAANGSELRSLPEVADDDDILRLAHARGTAAAKGSAASDALVALLESDSTRVRREAATLLRKIYRNDLGFAAYDKAAQRTAAAGRWKNLVPSAAAGPDPVRLGASARGEFQVLVGKKPGKTGAVLSYTTSGSSSGDHPLSGAMGGIDPNTITFDDRAGVAVASGGTDDGGRITVLSTEGNELWSISGFPSGGGCALLDGGKLLVAIGEEVERLDVTGSQIDKWVLDSPIASFHQLRNDRFLCCHPETGIVAEYDNDGKLLWSKDGFDRPTRVTRLENGNLLIVIEPTDDDGKATGTKLLETAPSGRDIVAKFTPKGVRKITSAARLPNGNTLLGTEKGLAEYTPAGFATKVWIKTAISSLHVR